MEQCSNCQRVYSDDQAVPKILPCGHTYCLLCIQTLSSAGTFLCQKDSLLYETSSEEIKTNFALLETPQRNEPADSPKCLNGHLMSELVIMGAPLKCSICERASSEYYHCPLCQDQTCVKCWIWMKSTKTNKLNIKCFNNHPLRDTENVEEFYKKIWPDKKHDYFLCDGCITRKQGNSSQCRMCKVDYCEECMNKLEVISENCLIICRKKIYSGIFGRVAGNFTVCNVQIPWRCNAINFSCEGCGNKFNKSGSFICRHCSVSYCISCAFNKLTRN